MIRAYQHDDQQAALALLYDLVKELEPIGGVVKPGLRTTLWLKSCLDGPGVCKVAEVGSDLVGVSLAIGTELPYTHEQGNVAIGVGTYVTPSHRKQGHASQLYREVAKQLEADGYHTYLGGVLLGNQSAHPVLQSVGFVPYEMAVRMTLGGAPC